MPITTPELIAAKRDGLALDPADLAHFISEYARGNVPDYQVAAFAMAVFFRGMTEQETVALTLAMRDSGRVLDLSHIPGRKIDKHSTGGIGDKVTLALAPLVAACGVRVPSVAGRGLGHTGGTVDKLEAIPGFSMQLAPERFVELVATVGVALAAQTDEIAPADRRFYALRDVTATVESVPLIVASILSKKLAEGIDGLVLDVKVGSGAFMRDEVRARELAEALVRVARGAGKDCVALLTRMDQPLGCAVGNALEVREAFALLHGAGTPDLHECTHALGAEMLVMGRVARTVEEAREMLSAAISSGKAREVARAMVSAQGGDPRVVDEPDRVLPKARIVRSFAATRDGFVGAMDARGVGYAAIAVGAGRTRSEDTVDPAVGFVFARRAGDEVRSGETIATVYANDDARADDALARLARAVPVVVAREVPGPVVIDRVT